MFDQCDCVPISTLAAVRLNHNMAAVFVRSCLEFYHRPVPHADLLLKERPLEDRGAMWKSSL